MNHLRKLSIMALIVAMLCGTISCRQEPARKDNQLDSLQLSGTHWKGTIEDEYTLGESLNAPYGIIFFSPSTGQASFPSGYASESKYFNHVTFEYTIHGYELSISPETTGRAINRFVAGKWLIQKATRDEIVLCRRPLTEIYIRLKRVER